MKSTIADAKAKIDEFEKRSSGTDWLFVKKDDLVLGMRSRLQLPDNVDSTLVNLCGPAAFFRCLAMDDPVAYVRAIISLYETNSALLGSRIFKASYGLRIAKLSPPTLMNDGSTATMSAVDWVPMASLRDDENSLISFDDADGGLSGLTMPSGLEKWFKQAGYTDIKNVTNLVLTKDQENIEKADWYRSMSGYRVCLLIDSDMLKAAKQNNKSLYPDHWVTLTEPVSINDGMFKTSVHSWGKIMPIPELGTMTLKVFLRNYYGYVAAKPA